MKIVITDADTLTTGDLSFSAFAAYGEVIRYGIPDPSRTIERVRQADAVLCNKTLITAEVMHNAPNLKYIGIFATGYNNVDLECARERGITVCNVPGYSTEGVVQLVFSYIFEIYGKLSHYRDLVNAGEWKKSRTFSYFPLPINGVAGRTIGIVGYGAIGRRVADVASALGMKVLISTRTVKPDCPYECVSFDQLLEKSDIVTLHCPLNPQSEGMMNSEAFSKMKDGAVFINTSRGPVVDEQALKEALESGKLLGAGLDVLQKEPMSEDCPLFGVKNCIITPHIAWAGLETRRRLLEIAADNLGAFLSGKPVNVVS